MTPRLTKEQRDELRRLLEYPGYAARDSDVLALLDTADECDALRAELERERMRLAGCGVAALGNTPESVAKRLDPENLFYSDSYAQVCRAVDREMALQAELQQTSDYLAQVTTSLSSARAEVELLRELEKRARSLLPLNGHQGRWLAAVSWIAGQLDALDALRAKMKGEMT